MLSMESALGLSGAVESVGDKSQPPLFVRSCCFSNLRQKPRLQSAGCCVLLANIFSHGLINVLSHSTTLLNSFSQCHRL